MTIFDKVVNAKLLGEWLGGDRERGPSKQTGCHTRWRSEADPSMYVDESEEYSIWVFPGESAALSRYRFWVRVGELFRELMPRCRDGRGNRVGGVNCSRLDVTMDQTGSDVLPVRFPMDVHEHFWKRRTFNHKFVSHRFLTNETGGLLRMRGRLPGELAESDWLQVSDETLYLGARQSEVMLRCYDEHSPLRWEWELKQGRALAVAVQLAERIRAGEQLGEVLRELWIGLAVERLACDWWHRLGEGEVVDPCPIVPTSPAANVAAMVNQYAGTYIAVDETGNHGRCLDLCRRRLDGGSRLSRYRARRLCKRIEQGGSVLWEDVGGRVLGGDRS